MNEDLRERAARQVAEARGRAAKMLADERAGVRAKLAPTSSFLRGVQVGALASGGMTTLLPGLLGVAEWPWWVRVPVAILMLALALNYLITQWGYSRADAIHEQVQV